MSAVTQIPVRRDSFLLRGRHTQRKPNSEEESIQNLSGEIDDDVTVKTQTTASSRSSNIESNTNTIHVLCPPARGQAAVCSNNDVIILR